MTSPPPSTATSASADATTTASAKEQGGFVKFLILLVLVAWAFRSFVVAPFSIPSGSMLPTLYIGDYLLVAKWPYGFSRFSFPLGIPSFDGRILSHDPARGDVVVFRHPGGNEDVIKRVIGIPGDRIAVEDGAVILNGKALQRAPVAAIAVPVSANSPCRSLPPAATVLGSERGKPACIYPAFRETLPGGPSYTTLDQLDGFVADNFAETRVPAGHVFLMGDNRDDSLDSRFSTVEGGMGMVPIENIIGRAMVTFWSTDGSASYANPLSWATALRSDRVGNGYSQ